MSNQEEQLTRKKLEKEQVRLSEARILPLDKKEKREIIKKFMNKPEWEKFEQIVMEDIKHSRSLVNSLNIWGTLMKNEDLSRRFLIYNLHIGSHLSLPERDREILILRNAWLCRSEYEWGQHSVFGEQAGLSNDEIIRIIEGPDAEEWNSFDSTLLRAVDELHNDAFISKVTWEDLAERYNTNQLIDLVFTVGNYHILALAMNTFGVQLEEGKKGFPK